jgi:hypothetical protein
MLAKKASTECSVRVTVLPVILEATLETTVKKKLRKVCTNNAATMTKSKKLDILSPFQGLQRPIWVYLIIHYFEL